MFCSTRWLGAGLRLHWFSVMSIWKVLSSEEYETTPASAGTLETDGVSSALGIIIINKGSLQQIILWVTQTSTPTLVLISQISVLGHIKLPYRRCPKCNGTRYPQLSQLSELTKECSSKCHFWGWSSFCKFLKSADLAWEGEVLTKKAPFLYSSFAGYNCVCRLCHKRAQHFPGATGNVAAWEALERSGQRMQRSAHSPPLPLPRTLTLTTVPVSPSGLCIHSRE